MVATLYCWVLNVPSIHTHKTKYLYWKGQIDYQYIETSFLFEIFFIYTLEYSKLNNLMIFLKNLSYGVEHLLVSHFLVDKLNLSPFRHV